MARKEEEPEVQLSTEPRSLAIARAGITTGSEFAALMSALMGDIIEGSITPNVASATVNAGRQLLRITEMQYRYGPAPRADEATPTLQLVGVKKSA